ncbi:MAG: alanine--tRNA ligase [Alphaproteobacteria bacterium]
MITPNDLRKKYLEFFKSKNHAVIRSASLIPENDPSVLFTTAGMHPLVPYLLGQKHPAGTRLVDVQKCIRTGDIDEVGDATHLTFFEMLGNWSLGDYFKEESIAMSYEFLTKHLNLDPKALAVTCFAGDADAPRDEESAGYWRDQGLSDDQIFFYGKDDNWWGAGATGPCGPDTEIFTNNLSMPKCCDECGPACNCGKYVEIWNNVFMEYNANADGTYTKLSQKNVDTGMGLERTYCKINKIEDLYLSELFVETITEIENLSGHKYEDNKRAFRRIADHIRTSTFILGDERGVAPSNTEQGYILRRLIRTTIRNLKKLGINDFVLPQLSQIVIDKYQDAYPELKENKDFILTQLSKEEQLFNKTIAAGLKEINKIISYMGDNKVIAGKTAFRLYDTCGFPLEFTQEIADEHGLSVDVEGFNKCFAEHQEKSRQGAENKFKGGLADNSEQTTNLHTATHLLHKALRNKFGETVGQKGSNITVERLRFDFSFDRKVTREELDEIEAEVNDVINQGLEVSMEEMSFEQAQAKGAIGLFAHKYDENNVKVYSVGDYSMEVCGGPHAKNSKDLGKFKIKKEEASSAGVRRIKATLEK